MEPARRRSLFHDRARIFVRGGRGGDGGLSFRREKHVPKGGPDGGDGGPGGSVVLVADPELRDLSGFRHGQRFVASSGQPGRSALKHGASGETLELPVPVGTQVLDEEERLIADLIRPAARAVVASGGGAGRGNKRFASPTRQTPRFAETGLPGEEAWLTLQLKLLADAALVGLPNAGKSSLLARISNARPKVAEYPFTTLQPMLGTVDSPSGRQLVVADVPGLIEGASEGIGLGHEFLAHLERARLLLHVIDAATGEPLERFVQIQRELEAYGAGLDQLPQVVVLNKIDLLPEPPATESWVGHPQVLRVFAVSCATAAGIEEFRRALFSLCPEPDADSDGAPDEALADYLVYRPSPRRRSPYRILRTDRGFRVVGDPPGEDELETALRAAGARDGDEIEIGEELLEFLS
ncbi:MAG: GTPase ObgE [Actinobacteria bacterium]|nr:GTPase ObgE [Actinomycetota bacterium]